MNRVEIGRRVTSVSADRPRRAYVPVTQTVAQETRSVVFARVAGGSSALELGPGQHVRDHVRHRYHGKAGLVGAVHDQPQRLHCCQERRILLGIDVAADPSTTISPQIVSVKNANGRSRRATDPLVLHASDHQVQDLNRSDHLGRPDHLPVPKAGQAPADYTVQVRGNDNTTGDYLLGFYLPGDVAGTGTVTTADLSDHQVRHWSSQSTLANYNFDADVNRDGHDLAQSTWHLPPWIWREHQDQPGHQRQSRPGCTIPSTTGSPVTRRELHRHGHARRDGDLHRVNNNSPGATTTADSSGNYSIMVPLGIGSNTFRSPPRTRSASRSPARLRRSRTLPTHRQWSTRPRHRQPLDELSTPDASPYRGTWQFTRSRPGWIPLGSARLPGFVVPGRPVTRHGHGIADCDIARSIRHCARPRALPRCQSGPAPRPPRP